VGLVADNLIVTNANNAFVASIQTLNFQMYEKAELAIVEQTVSDLMFLTENDGKLKLDNGNNGQS